MDYPATAATVHEQAAPGNDQAGPLFFTASTAKLTLMSLATFGLYDLYWFYKNWRVIKLRNGTDIMPFWRAVFASLWSYTCFRDIKAVADARNIPNQLSAGGLAAWYFLLNMLWRLPDPYWLISMAAFLCLLPANALALRINRDIDPAFVNNSKFSGWNWLAFIIVGLLFLLGIIGAFLPDADPALGTAI